LDNRSFTGDLRGAIAKTAEELGLAAVEQQHTVSNL
jgi:hypothetical protein